MELKESNERVKALQESLNKIHSKLNSIPSTIQGAAPIDREIPNTDIKPIFDFENAKGLSEYFGELKTELKETKQEQIQLRQELQTERDSHKHDTLKQVIITMFGCILSFLLGRLLA